MPAVKNIGLDTETGDLENKTQALALSLIFKGNQGEG